MVEFAIALIGVVFIICLGLLQLLVELVSYFINNRDQK